MGIMTLTRNVTVPTRGEAGHYTSIFISAAHMACSGPQRHRLNLAVLVAIAVTSELYPYICTSGCHCFRNCLCRASATGLFILYRSFLGGPKGSSAQAVCSSGFYENCFEILSAVISMLEIINRGAFHFMASTFTQAPHLLLFFDSLLACFHKFIFSSNEVKLNLAI